MGLGNPIPGIASHLSWPALALALVMAGSCIAAEPSPARPKADVLDQRVQFLTSKLDLTPSQQARLKNVLVDERRQLREATTGGPPNADHVGRIKDVLDRTREKIRDLLTEDQRKKYPGVTPSDLLGPAHADVEGWIRATQGKSGPPPRSVNP